MKKLLLTLFIFLGYASIAQVNPIQGIPSDKIQYQESIASPPCSGFGIYVFIDSSTPDNGIISIQNVQGAVYPITVSWVFPDGSTHVGNPLSNLTQRGEYTYIVTDAIGCSSSPFTVPLEGCIGLDSLGINTNAYGITTINGNDGIIDLDVSGGSGGFSYQWSGPNNFSDSTQDISTLTPGTYSVTITDTLCSLHYMDSVTVVVPGYDICNLAERATTLLSKDEYSQDSASITAHVVGGRAPYTYQWTFPDSTVETTQDSILYPLSDSGAYSVYITDSAGCEIGTFHDSLYKCVGLEDISISYIVQATSHPNKSDGGIDLTINGGSGDYSIQWVGPYNYLSTSEDLNWILAGNYLVQIEDKGCPQLSYSTSINIWSTSTNDIQLADLFQVFPSPNNGTFHIQIENLKENVNLHVRNIVGQSIYQEKIEASNVSKQVSLNTISKGIYWVELVNSQGIKNIKKMVIQ